MFTPEIGGTKCAHNCNRGRLLTTKGRRRSIAFTLLMAPLLSCWATGARCDTAKTDPADHAPPWEARPVTPDSIASALHALDIAFDCGKKVVSQDQRDHILGDIVQLTAQLAPIVAVARLKDIINDEKRLCTTSEVFAAWCAKDAEAAMKQQALIGMADEKAWALTGIVEGLKDLKQAEAIASTIQDKQAREQAFYSVGCRMAKADPSDLPDFRGKTDTHSCDIILGIAVRAAVERHDLKSAELLCNRPMELMGKEDVLPTLARGYRLNGDFDAALRVAESTPKGIRDAMLVGMISALAKRDPSKAWRAVEKVDPGLAVKERAYFEFARGLETKSEDVDEWSQKVTDPGYKSWFLAGLTAGKADHGDIALPLPAQLSGTEAGDAALMVMAEECQRQRLSWAAVDAALLITREGRRDITLDFIAQRIGESEPLKALAVSQLIQDLYFRCKGLQEAGWYLTASDEASKPWVSSKFRQLADELAQKWQKHLLHVSMLYTILNELVSGWALVDARAAADYLSTHEPAEGSLEPGVSDPEAMGMVYAHLGEGYASHDCAEAFAWGKTMNKPPLEKARFFYGVAEGALGQACVFWELNREQPSTIPLE